MNGHLTFPEGWGLTLHYTTDLVMLKERRTIRIPIRHLMHGNVIVTTLPALFTQTGLNHINATLARHGAPPAILQ